MFQTVMAEEMKFTTKTSYKFQNKLRSFKSIKNYLMHGENKNRTIDVNRIPHNRLPRV